MKKVLSLLMSFMILLTCFGAVSAASDLDLTFHITNELDYDGDYVIEVPHGTIITVAFLIENNDGEPFSLSSLQNEIYFDKTFFSYAQGAAVEYEGTECALKEYSDGEQRVFVNRIDDADMSKKQLIATFKLKVDETTTGASSTIETKSQLINGANPGIKEKNLTVVIGETPADTRRFDITYQDTDGKVLFIDEDIIGGQTTHLNSTITKDGYVLNGWLINGTPYQPGDAINVTGNITAIADWKASATYTLSFDSKGGSFVPAVSGYSGEIIQLSQKPEKSGYTFSGWYISSSYTGSPVTSIALTEDTTVYAKWTALPPAGGGGGGTSSKKNTITFKTPDGIELDKIERTTGSTIDLSKYKYDKDGYDFSGWYTDKELTDNVRSIQLTEDITLYAKWVASENKPDYKPAILTDEHYAYIVGRDGGMIAPESDITRAEVATIIYRLLDEDERSKAKTRENVFTDVNEGEWFNTAVSTLAALELVNGRTADTFAPDAFITRAELATIFARMVDVEYDGKVLFSDISGHWAESYINEASTAEWIVGFDGLFRPDDNITRAEVMTLVNRVLNREPENKADLLDGMIIWVDNANENAWYYLAIQEATNSHTHKMKADNKHEKWVTLTENPDWSKLED